MVLASATFLSDTIKFIRDRLDASITDPLSASRVGRERFVMTSYPKRNVKYPIITVQHMGTSQIQRLGMQSEGVQIRMPMEVRIWARNIKERDEITEEVYTFLRTNQFDGATSSTGFNIHDFSLNSRVSVDEPGTQGIKSSVMEYSYFAIVG